MKTPIRIIPCLDVLDGRVVKGVQFEELRDIGDPASLGEAYQAQGADELALLDISATEEGRATSLAVVAAVRERISIPLTVGGGIRSVEDAARLLQAGADKISIGSAAIDSPSLIDELASRFGSERVVIAMDAAASTEFVKTFTNTASRRRANERGPSRAMRELKKSVPPWREQFLHGRWEVVVRGGKVGTGRDPIAWAREVTERGAGSILLTSRDRDGTRAGYDLALLRAVAGATALPVIASGGAATLEDLLDGVRAGASALLAASIFHDGDRRVAEIKAFLASRGIDVASAAVSEASR